MIHPQEALRHYRLCLWMIFISLGVVVCSAQNWSQPVNISNQTNLKNRLDFCVDGVGTLHCVWMGGDAVVYKIYYARSGDGGATWTAPLQVSDVDGYTRYYPKIAAVGQDSLFITYTCTFEGTEVMRLKCYDGDAWLPEQTVSPPGVNAINLAIASDPTGGCYSFWQAYEPSVGYKFNYVHLGSGSSNTPISPFTGIPGNHLVYSVVADSMGNLHCSGSWRDSAVPVVNACYYKYDRVAALWLPPVSMQNLFDAYKDGSDIALTHSGLPILTWREVISPSPLNDRSRISFYNETSWSDPITIAEDPWFQTIVADATDTVHLVQTEKFFPAGDEVKNLVYYTSNGWEGQVITNSANIASFPELRIHNNTLYLVYVDSASLGDNNVFFMKRVLTGSGIIDQEASPAMVIGSLCASPNPFRGGVDISYELCKPGRIFISICNLRGQVVKTFEATHNSPGKYTLAWDGKDLSGKPTASGIYLGRMQSGSKTRSFKLFRLP